MPFKKLYTAIVALLFVTSSALCQTVNVYLTTSGGSYATEKWVNITTGANGTGSVIWQQGGGTIGTGAGLVTDEVISLSCGTTYFLNTFDRYDDSWDGTTYELRDAAGGGGTLIINNGGNSPDDGTDSDATSTWGTAEYAVDIESSESFSVACPCLGTAPTGTVTTANLDCVAGTYDIQVTAINNGTATSTDIYVDGVLDVAGSELLGKTAGTSHTVVLKPVGGGTTCETTYSNISAACTTPCSGSATAITDGYTQSNITTPGSGGADDWVTYAESCGTASAGEFEDSDVKLYSYTTGATAGESFYFTIQYDYSIDESHSIGVWKECIADSLTNCVTSYYNFDDIAGVCAQGLDANTTYYIGVSNNYFNREDLDFDIIDFTVETSTTIPDDECATAASMDISNSYDGSTRCSYTASSGSPSGCGTVENDSWVSFVADSTTAIIDYGVTNCTNGNGVQLSVWSGACSSLSLIPGSCLNYAANNSSGTWTFSGLTIGNTYYIRADGYAGDLCSYSYTPVGGIVLPVTLTEFKGTPLANGYNRLEWVTSSEINSDFFVLEKSENATDFVEVSTQNAAGNSNSTLNYFGYDIPTKETTYYRLKQVDFDGSYTYSKIIAINNNKKQLKIYPNPSIDGYVNLQQLNGSENITITNSLGKQIANLNSNGESNLRIDLSSYPKGLYYITIRNDENLLTKKLIIK